MEIEPDKTEIIDEKYEDPEFSWEKEYERSWERINEDDKGKIVTTESESTEWRQKKRIDIPVKRSILRYLVISIDLSKDALETDQLPSRLGLIQSVLPHFLRTFFDQNPLSMVSIICTKDKKTFELSPLSYSPKVHIDAIQSLEASGQQSLQSCLELAYVSMSTIPKYIKKEILCFINSLSTSDPGDIYTTINKLKQEKIMCSVISLGGEVHLYKELSHSTGGSFDVPINKIHLQNILSSYSFPPASLPAMDPPEEIVLMGFPNIKKSNSDLCDCHLTHHNKLYKCPNCASQVCSIPCSCPICQLLLVDSTYLTRSYHYLFPVPNFIKLKTEATIKCTSCFSLLDASTPKYQCPKCKNYFCSTCDTFIHESLFNCPKCLS
ncbi:hypothetical protein WA158_007961 [Blastocystis sp. Blastoise]